MQLEILLLVAIYGNSILCGLTNRSIHFINDGKKVLSKREILTKNMSVNNILHSHNSTNYDIAKNNIHENEMKNMFSKKSIDVKKPENIDKLYSDDINVSGLVESSFQFGISSNRDLYVYNEIFRPWEYVQLEGNYFNSKYMPEEYNAEVDHIRDKRFPQVFYKGNPESQFTFDNINEYINLKTGKRTKRNSANLEKAFQKLEMDIAELTKLKLNNISSSNGN